MLIAQISDTHIVENGNKTLGVAPMEANIQRVVGHINNLVPPPDVVILTGDVTDAGTLEQTNNAARLLRELKAPLFVIPGNHDDRTALWSVFQGAACPAKVDDYICYVVEGFDVRMIALDTAISNAPGGELCETRLNWLEERLLEDPERPTVLFMHHPPIKCGVLETDVDGFIGAGKLGSLINKHTNIERILCGHIHLPTHARFEGSVVSTAPSIGMRLALDLTKQNASAFFLDRPGYQLHHWTDQKRLISHTIYVDEADGPYLF